MWPNIIADRFLVECLNWLIDESFAAPSANRDEIDLRVAKEDSQFSRQVDSERVLACPDTYSLEIACLRLNFRRECGELEPERSVSAFRGSCETHEESRFHLAPISF